MIRIVYLKYNKKLFNEFIFVFEKNYLYVYVI